MKSDISTGKHDSGVEALGYRFDKVAMGTPVQFIHMSDGNIPTLVKFVTFSGIDVPGCRPIETCSIQVNQFSEKRGVCIMKLLQ